MIVQLGSESIASGGTGTFQYNAMSLQKVYFAVDGLGAGEATNYSITVQIGNRTLVNNVSAFGLQLINASQVGGYNADISTTGTSIYGINLGSHVCGNDSIYVTVQAGTLSSAATVRVGALINEPVGSLPLKITEYSDSSFADQNTLQAYIYKTSSLLADNNTVEVRNSAFSTTSPIAMYVIANASDGFIDQRDYDLLGKLMSSSLPLSTTFNNQSTNNIICVSGMENSPQDRSVAKSQARAVASSLTPSERRAL